jgi:four helix bundle suffix protein
MSTPPESLIPPHGGYRNLKTFRLARLIYDVTVRFCDRYIDRRSRTHDQMVQAARSGPQNIAEGSADSATSKKSELKLTGVAKGSLEELRLDYQDYLRQRDLPQWPPEHPVLRRFKARRVATLNEFRQWVADEVKLAEATRTDTDVHGQTRTEQQRVRVGPCTSVGSSVSPPSSVSPALLPPTLVANGALSLLNVCLHLLKQQLASQADAFVRRGGFTERLYRVRSAARRGPNPDP